MATLIVEDREFTDRQTGITTNYKYYAIKGLIGFTEYEIPLKNLVGSEKTALEMLANAERSEASKTNYKTEYNARPSTEAERKFFDNANSDDDKINLDED